MPHARGTSISASENGTFHPNKLQVYVTTTKDKRTKSQDNENRSFIHNVNEYSEFPTKRQSETSTLFFCERVTHFLHHMQDIVS